MSTLTITNTFVAYTRIKSADVNTNFTDITTWANGNITNNNIGASAAIAYTKLAALTFSRALVSDGAGVITPATTTATEIGYVNGVTSAIQTQLDAKVAKSAYTAKGDILAATAASTPAAFTVGADGKILQADSSQAAGLAWVNNGPTFSNEAYNLGLAASVGSNALTISLKQADGATNPSTGTGAVRLGFRSATATSGAYVERSVTAALSVVISSGSTLGHANALNGWIYVYAIDNAGTVELAVSGQAIADSGSVTSTTAEGGAGAADSNVVLYSTTARSNVACRLIGRMKSNQTTAGTWAAVPTEISVAPFMATGNRHEVYLTATSGFGSTNTKIRRFNAVTVNTGTAITLTQSATNGDSCTINEDGIYAMCYQDSRSAGTAYHGISVNSAALTTTITSEPVASRLGYVRSSADCDANFSCTTFLRAGDIVRPHTDGTQDNGCFFRIVKVMPLL